MHITDHIVAAIICIFAPMLAFSSRRISAEDIQFNPGDKIKLYHSNALLLVVLALVVATVWRVPGRSMEGLGFVWPDWNPWVTLLISAIFIFYAVDVFLQYGLRRWREKTLQERNRALTFVPADNKEFVHFIFLALAAGIGEEIIFRGYLIHYVVFWTGNTPEGIVAACLFSSALFAFLHGYQGFRSMVKIFVLATLFAAIFVLSNSLLIVILVHTVIDILSGWLGIYMYRNIPEKESSEQDT
jgi:membrane protease YdiL (CAAX protease family)